MTLETSFSIKLKKPNLYVITWKASQCFDAHDESSWDGLGTEEINRICI